MSKRPAPSENPPPPANAPNSKRRKLLGNSTLQTDSHGCQYDVPGTTQVRNVRNGIMVYLNNGYTILFAFNLINGLIRWHKGENNTVPVSTLDPNEANVVKSALSNVTVPNVDELQKRANGIVGTLWGGMAFLYDSDGTLKNSVVFQYHHRGPTVYTLAQRMHHIINVFAGEQVDIIDLPFILFHPPETSKMTATMARNAHAEWTSYTQTQRLLSEARAQIASLQDDQDDFFASIENGISQSAPASTDVRFREIDQILNTDNDLSLPDLDLSLADKGSADTFDFLNV